MALLVKSWRPVPCSVVTLGVASVQCSVCVICPSPLIAAYAVATVRGPIALILKRSFSEERTAKNEIALIQKNFHLPCSVCILELDVSCEERPAGLPLKPMTMNDL